MAPKASNTKYVKIFGLTLVIMFAIGALALTTAIAAEHVYKVEGKELKAGEEKEIAAKASEEFTLRIKGVFEIEGVAKCKKLKLKSSLKPVIVGGIPGTSKNEVIELEECSGTVGGTKCASVEIVKEPTHDELVTIRAPSELAGKLATLFTPASGKVLAKIKFNNCGVLGNQVATVEGTTAALVEPEAIEALEENLVWNEKMEITEIEKQNGAKEKVGLTSSGKKATLNGKAAVSLVSVQKWGAF